MIELELAFVVLLLNFVLSFILVHRSYDIHNDTIQRLIESHTNLMNKFLDLQDFYEKEEDSDDDDQEEDSDSDEDDNEEEEDSDSDEEEETYKTTNE